MPSSPSSLPLMYSSCTAGRVVCERVVWWGVVGHSSDAGRADRCDGPVSVEGPATSSTLHQRRPRPHLQRVVLLERSRQQRGAGRLDVVVAAGFGGWGWEGRGVIRRSGVIRQAGRQGGQGSKLVERRAGRQIGSAGPSQAPVLPVLRPNESARPQAQRPGPHLRPSVLSEVFCASASASAPTPS